MKKSLLLCIALLLPSLSSLACTNFLVGRNASVDGSTFVTYNMDIYRTISTIPVSPAGKHKAGETVKVYDYDSQRYMGEIPQAPQTYGVVGYINDRQLSIVETTWGGREGQANPDGLIHYTSLMRLALQRSANAREAIRTMGNLVAEYGYASSGETFSIADPEEVWLMEMIGKGSDGKGAVWVAVRVPDDCICAHANQSRIHRFDLNDPENVIYAEDVISYARSKGFFTGPDEAFDFSKAYSPTNFHMQRACEARVWSIFNRFSDDFGKYIRTVDGMHLDDYEEMPLFIRPNRKVSLEDAMNVMRDHYEGTPFDMNLDVSGGPWLSPYRPRPQEYVIDGVRYFHERPIATQHSAAVMVCQMRSFLPDDIGGVMWYGNDDASMIAYTPVYCSVSSVPSCYNDPKATDTEFSWDSAFWVCNWVSNMVYSHYSVKAPKLHELRDELQGKYLSRQEDFERRAVSLKGRKRVEAVTGYCAQCADEMMSRWKDLGIHLIVMYNDLAVKPEKDGIFLTTPEGCGVPPVREGYCDEYRRAIAASTGDRYCTGELTFIHMTDPQIGFFDDTPHFVQTDSLMKEAIDAANRIKPACVIITGDLTNDRFNAEQRSIFESRLSELAPTIPVFITPGNHDLSGFSHESLKDYLGLIGYDRFTFTKGDCAFIGFDSCRIKDGTEEDEREQFDWLCTELEKVREFAHIFVFCHCPIVEASLDEEYNHNSFPVNLRQKYLDTFSKYGVEAMFSGHAHTGHEIYIRGLRSVNSGPVARAFGDHFSGINVVTVTRDSTYCHYVPAAEAR